MRSKHFLGLCLAVGSFAAVGLGTGCGGDPTVGTTSSGSGGGDGGSGSTTATATSTTTGTTTGTTTSTSASGSSSSTGTGGPVGDGNDTFEDALPIDATGVIDTLEDPSIDADYFKFEGTAGEMWLISANSHFTQGTDADPGYIDTFIQLYDPTQKLFATNDDSYPGRNTDSELLTVLPTTGTYYVKVLEWCNSPTKDKDLCDSKYFEALTEIDYGISAGVIKPSLGTVLEVEPNDAFTAATPVTFAPTATVGSYFLTITSGKMPMSSDSDWYSFTVPANLTVGAAERARVNVIIPWGSTTGNGSDVKVGKVDVYDQSGMVVIGSLDMSAESHSAAKRAELTVPVTKGGNYLLKVNHGGAEPDGQGPFYFVYESVSDGNPVETADATNTDPKTPEVLKVSGTAGSYFVEGNLGVGDLDHFKIATGGKPTISVACSSLRSGSGLAGFKATVYLADGVTPVAKATATETATTDLFVDHVVIPAGTTDLVVKLEGALPAGSVNTGTFYVCGIHAAAAVAP